MAILVTMQVGPVDWDKFHAASEWANGAAQPTGRRSINVYRGEHDPSTVLVVEEWDSHASMHAYQEAVGDEFNRRAGTDGLEWRTATWQVS